MAMTIFLHKQVVSTSMMVSRSAKKNIYIYIYIQMFSLRCMTWRLEQEPLMVAVRACRRKGHKMDFAGAKLRNSEFGR